MARPISTPSKVREPKDARSDSPSLEAGLYVVATPIGNLRDITLRALDVLAAADLVLAEDTRVARKLLDAHGVASRVEAYHEHNAEETAPRILAAIAEGKAVALTTDAGTPLVSDPGYRLARDVAAAGGKVIPIPGASALLAGLVVSGLPSDRFLFAGFPPTKPGARAAFFGELAQTPASLVFFETGPRLKESLAAMRAVFGDRRAAVARELTKLFEEVRRGSLSTLEAETDAPPRGEIVIVVAPPSAEAAPDAGPLDAALARLFAAGVSIKEAAQRAALETGVPRKAAYARALELKPPT